MLNVSFSARRPSGFTLVEMIVVVAILSILLAFSAPSFRTLLINTQLRSTAESLMAGMQLARSEAVRRNTAVSFWMVNHTNAGCALTNSGTSWVVSLDSLTGNCNAAASATTSPRIVQVRAGNEVGGNITIAATDAAAANANCVTFNGFGSVVANCTGSASTPITQIRVSSSADNTRTQTVRIMPGGAVRLE